MAKFYLVLALLLVIATGYIFYSTRLKTFTINDVSTQQAFKVNNNTGSKPLNIDLSVFSNTDSSFNIRVVGLPSRNTLFDSSFRHKQINFSCKIDYYSGSSAEIPYTPAGAQRGIVKISARINPDF